MTCRSYAAIVVLVCLVGSRSRLLADTPYPHIAPTEAKAPAEELKTFKVPPGFEVQLVASEPDIRKPIQMAFDAKGRLWVTTSEEYPFPAVGRPGKDRLYILDDFGPDGKAKKISIFADDLNIPIGVLPLPDCKSVIVSSIEPAPNKDTPATCWIWKLTDTDGDGKYDKKEKLYGPFGCRDTHGMNNSYTLMPDGWVYACHGYSNDSRPKGKDGHEIFMNSGNTFRFRLDGSRIENWTYGQVNPFGIAVDPYFNLYTADCHSRPITQLIRGATYQSFSKPHDGLGFAPHVTIHGHDSTALCGLVYYAADHFPKEHLDCMFLGNVTSNCINWDKIEFKGSTPVGIDKGMFLSSSDYWFRPTDIKLGPDGALYFADFYNKIIGHYEVDLHHKDRDKLRGRVWRIVWKGLDGKNPPPKMVGDLTKATNSAVCQNLGNRNLAVRLLATNELLRRDQTDGGFFQTLLGQTNKFRVAFAAESEGRAHLDWYMMMRMDRLSPDNRSMILGLKLNARDEKARVLPTAHLVRIAATIPNWTINNFNLDVDELGREIRPFLNHKNALLRRAGIDALMAHPNPKNIQPLLRAQSGTPNDDDHLRYGIRVALRESLRSIDDWDKAADKNEWTATELKALADIAPAVPNKSSAQFLIKHFRDLADTGRLPEYVQHAARYAPDASWAGNVLVFVRDYKPDDLTLSMQLFQAYQRGRQQAGDNVFTDASAVLQAEKLSFKALASADAGIVQTGIEIAAAWKLTAAFKHLVPLATNSDRPVAQRVAALGGLMAIDAAKAMPILVQVLNAASEPIALREKSAQLLAGSNRPDARDELVKALQAAPARLQTVIALDMAGNAGAADKLLKAVEEGKASARLLQDKTVQTKLNESKLPKVGERIAALTKGLPSADQRLTQMITTRSAGFNKAKPDAVLGKQVFTKNCAICHQIGNEGVKIGPQLDGIGGRGLDRLLEDVLDPNRNVDAAFRQTTLILKDGKSLPGLVLREEGQIVVLADDKGKEARIPKDDIDERRTSQLSPMPSNVSDIIAEKDFYDLMAYLLTQRAKEK